MHSCPKDRLPLAMGTVHGWSVSKCATCAGLWLDANFVANAVGPIPRPGLPITWAAATCLRCPKDDSTMMAVHHRGVEIDVCTACGGVWLDHGEIERILVQRVKPEMVAAKKNENSKSLLDVIDVVEVGANLVPDEAVASGLEAIGQFIAEALSGF